MEAVCEPFIRRCVAISSLIYGAIVAGLLGGCASLPVNSFGSSVKGRSVMQEVMARENRLILVSSPELDSKKPVLLLLHGATEDPMEMMAIANAWKGTYNVFIYAYNFHQPIQDLGSQLVSESKRLRAAMSRFQDVGKPIEDLTVV